MSKVVKEIKQLPQKEEVPLLELKPKESISSTVTAPKHTTKASKLFYIFTSLDIIPIILLLSFFITFSEALFVTSFIVTLSILPFIIIANILYIFYIEPKERFKAYIFNLILIIFSSTTIILVSYYLYSTLYGGPYFHNGSYYYNGYYTYLYHTYMGVFIVTVIALQYGLLNNFWLKTTLLFYNKPIRVLLFKGDVERSPAEMEWRKYNKRSGIIALVLGFLLLQPIWLIYHFLIRPKKIKNAKIRLMVESLNFEDEVNTTTIALELGIPLEEVIYHLKELNLKQEIIVELTRYGVILKEIRSRKWFTPKMKEKYELYLLSKKRTEIEIHASKLLDLAERERVTEEQFRKVLKLKPSISIEDLLLILPPKIAYVKKPFISNIFKGAWKKKWIYFNKEEVLRKREKILVALTEHADEIFDLKQNSK